MSESLTLPEVRALKQEILSSLHCAMPGVVESFDASFQTGWQPEKMISVKWKDGSAEGLVLERSVDADNMKGNWQCELLVEKV